MNDNEKERAYKKSKTKLRNIFMIFTAAIIILVVITTILLEYGALSAGWISEKFKQPAWLIAAVSIGITSALTGMGLAVIASRIMLKPIDDLLDGMSKLTNGDYGTRIQYSGPEAIRRVYNEFNALAQELQNVEILRSDFVNNFSHEFKTPIMSINGLIGLIKNKDLPKEKQVEYLEIIEEETNRLSLMTTNILNMTKLENQALLTDAHRYNVSEQIRVCVLMLEKRWTQKALSLSMDFDEFYINANEDLMKQVWLNILDNAVKFSNDGGEMDINISEKDGNISVSIGNTGPDIAEEDRDKVFNKFYRGKKTNNESGNGIGLSIVKKIIDLHKGSVSFDTSDGKTVFTVTLPVERGIYDAMTV